MNPDEAATVRDQLNDLDVVEGPDDDSGDFAFRLARVSQPGYTNGEPTFEVLLSPTRRRGSVHIPRELLDWLADAEYYLRVDRDDGGDVHIRGPV